MAFQLAALRELKATHGKSYCPYPLHFEPNGLLPLGATDNGDTVFWITRGHPDQWSVLIGAARAPEFEPFDGSMVELVLAFLSGSFRSRLFPADIDVPGRVTVLSGTKSAQRRKSR